MMMLSALYFNISRPYHKTSNRLVTFVSLKICYYLLETRSCINLVYTYIHRKHRWNTVNLGHTGRLGHLDQQVAAIKVPGNILFTLQHTVYMYGTQS